jgi:hypothetical protein
MRTKTQTCADEERRRSAAIADAWRACEAAAEISRVSAEWSIRAELGSDDAAEAARAALRARHAAERAQRATTLVEAVAESRSAWAAAMSAMEADSRVVSTIVDTLAAGGPKNLEEPDSSVRAHETS